MAKTNVELQHLMTTSYSGGSVKDNDRDRQSSTLFNATPPDAYSTITDAQKEHAQYCSHQVRNPEGSVTSSNPSGGPPYEYDIIPPGGEETKRGMLGSVREDGGSGGGTVKGGSTKPGSFRQEAKNVMYEENELKPENLQHRGLRADSYRTYTGAVYQEPRESYVTCRCKAQNLIVTFFIVMAILFSVASLVLSALLWFGIYGGASSSDCSCPEQGAYEGLIDSLESLEETNANLATQLENLQNSSATLDDLSAGLSQLEKEKNQLNSTIQQIQNPDETQTFSVAVNNVDIYKDCQTVKVASCPVGQVDTGTETQSPCLTVETDMEVPGEFLQRSYCALDGPGVTLENNTIAATLEIIDNLLRCRCSKVIIEDDLGQTPELILCSLYVTRCATNPSINATLARLP